MQRATVVYRVWAVSPTHTNYRTERLRTATETLLTGGRRALVWVHERKRAPYRTQSDGRRTKSNRLHGEHEISGDWSEMTCILFSKGRHDVRWYRAQSQVAWEIFRVSRATLAVSRAYCTAITTHNNHHPAHYARRRDSAYMKLPGVFLHCDTCARVDGVAIRDSDTPFT